MTTAEIVEYLKERLALMTEHLGSDGYRKVVNALIESLKESK